MTGSSGGGESGEVESHSLFDEFSDDEILNCFGFVEEEMVVVEMVLIVLRDENQDGCSEHVMVSGSGLKGR